MADITDLVKEEFIQNYLQYRWLDDTRTRFIDRFFILTVAFIAAIQFEQYLTEIFSLFLYISYAIVAVAFARTIILFRRQQRGHVQYIKSLRAAVLKKIVDNPSPEFSGADSDLAEKYRRYIEGPKVFLTKWIEVAVALIAFFAAMISLFKILTYIVLTHTSCSWINEKCFELFSFVIIIVLIAWLLNFLFIPWRYYNFTDEINW